MSLLKHFFLALLLVMEVTSGIRNVVPQVSDLRVHLQSRPERNGYDQRQRQGGARRHSMWGLRMLSADLQSVGLSSEEESIALTQAQEIEEVGDGRPSSMALLVGVPSVGGILSAPESIGNSESTILVATEGNHSNVEALIRESVWRWFPEEEIDYVLCLSWNESRYDRLAVGAAGERGVLQISPYWNRGVLGDMGYTPDDLWDIDRNVQVAAEIRNRWNGFGAWSTRYLCGG